MTFASYETSTEGSRPIEIFTFVLGATSFYYTSAEDDVTVDTVTYEAIPGLSRGRLSDGAGIGKNSLVVEVPSSNKFARKYISVVPGQRARFTLKRVQRPDFPSPEVVTLFTGYVGSVAFSEQGLKAKIDIAPIQAATSRPVPRFTYQGLCNHVLYDSGCGVNSSDPAYRILGSVSAVSGNTITVDGLDAYVDGYFNSGFVEYNNGEDARLVLSHVGTLLTLLLPFPFDINGSNVVVFAGCDHTISTCGSKFSTTEDATSNVINYGGFAFVPTKDIFTSGLD